MKVYLYWAWAKTRTPVLASVHDSVGCAARCWSAPSGTAQDAKNVCVAKATGAWCSRSGILADARVRSASVVSGLRKCGARFADFAELLVVISCRFCSNSFNAVAAWSPGMSVSCVSAASPAAHRGTLGGLEVQTGANGRAVPASRTGDGVSARIDERSICYCATGAGQSCLSCAAVPVCDKPAGPRQVGTPRRLERLIHRLRRDLPVLRAHQLLQHRGCRRL
jgi:hypothetical protein